MADVVHKGFFTALLKGLLETTPDIRLQIVMSGTTANTEEDAVFYGDLTTIDEFDGVGYAEIDCANVAVAFDDASDELRIDMDDGQFGVGDVAPGTDIMQGMIAYLYVDGNPDNDYLLGYSEAAGFGVNAANGTLTLVVGDSGLIFGKQAA